MNLDDHLPDLVLEDYSVGVLAEADAAQCEQHLLVCAHCQDRLAASDVYVETMRQALVSIQARPAPSWREWWLDLWRWAAQPALAAALVALLVTAGLLYLRHWPWPAGGHSVAVMLQTSRGLDSLAGTPAPAGTPLRLGLDVTGLPQFPSYSVEMVDSSGDRVATAHLRVAHGALELAAPSLVPGRYWVRIYDPPQYILLREFSLRCE